jgi:hypothetical protein
MTIWPREVAALALLATLRVCIAIAILLVLRLVQSGSGLNEGAGWQQTT